MDVKDDPDTSPEYADMTRLSVNINKLATLRNARGGNNPDIVLAAKDIERFGADGITVHPRPDERHIRYADVFELKKILTTPFNIEGNPVENKFIDLVSEICPEQVTLVPDASLQLTSDHGWDTVRHAAFLKKTISHFTSLGIKVSIFVDPVSDIILAAKDTGTHRIELYTESYAKKFALGERDAAVSDYKTAYELAISLGLEVNAGHDLDLKNLGYFSEHLPNLHEVSIGHALICDSIYYGLENTVQLYKRQLRKAAL
jgi:pyridoxine 5-phosphate synthase